MDCEVWTTERRAMIADMVGEMVAMDWRERRLLVNKVVQVAIAALRLRIDPLPNHSSLWAEVIEGVVGQVVASVIDRLGEHEVVCGDQAYVFALSANENHRRAARNWFSAHPQDWDVFGAGGPTVH